jgi:cell filamentation protein, protein adenylyltransferase
MDPSVFQPEAPGECIKIENGEWAFRPDPLPPVINLTKETHELHAEARAIIGIIRGKTSPHFIPNVSVLLHPLKRIESIHSSSIEGTTVSEDDMVLFELSEQEEQSPKVSENVIEVGNHANALEQGESDLESHDYMTLATIRGMHQTLMRSARGESKHPGQFRTSQVFIGSDHRFTPPPGHLVPECMGALESYWKQEDTSIPLLIRAFLVHYQFETIHPFFDGNGRIGRVILSLQIAKWTELERPWIYLSAYFEEHRREYMDALYRVSTENTWENWIAFCLRAVIAQGKMTSVYIDNVLQFRMSWREKIEKTGMKASAFQLVDQLVRLPVITTSLAADTMEVTYNTARRYLEKLVDQGLLVRHQRNKKTTWYIAPEVIKLRTIKSDA